MVEGEIAGGQRQFAMFERQVLRGRPGPHFEPAGVDRVVAVDRSRVFDCQLTGEGAGDDPAPRIAPRLAEYAHRFQAYTGQARLFL